MRIAKHDSLAADPTQQLPRFCYHCARSFPTVIALQAHFRHAHAAVHPLEYIVEGTVCQACMKEYWTRARLLHHVKHSQPACGRALERSFRPFNEEHRQSLAADLAAHAKEMRRTGDRTRSAIRPCVRRVGPCIAPAPPE